MLTKVEKIIEKEKEELVKKNTEEVTQKVTQEVTQDVTYNLIFDLVSSGDLARETGMKKTGLSYEEFTNKLKEYQESQL